MRGEDESTNMYTVIEGSPSTRRRKKRTCRGGGGEKKNRGKWKKGRVMRHVRRRDGVIMGVTLLLKVHHNESPLSLVCPLEIKGPVATEDGKMQRILGIQQAEGSRSRRQAAQSAKEKIRQIAIEEDDD